MENTKRKELALEWVKKYADPNLQIGPIVSLTLKTNSYCCKICKKSLLYCIKTLRKNTGKIKLKCEICYPGTRGLGFKKYKERVFNFNPDYKLDPKSYTNTSGDISVTHTTCGTTWTPRAKDLMEGRSNCENCGGRMKWTNNSLNQFAKKFNIDVIKFDDKKINSQAEFRCQKNHFFKKRPASFKQYANEGNPCPDCSRIKQGLASRKYKHDEIKKITNDRGYELLTPKAVVDSDQFKLEKNKIELKCYKNHLFSVTFNNFYNNNSDCKTCKKDQAIHFREQLCRLILQDMTGNDFFEYTIPKSDSTLQGLLNISDIRLSKNSLSIDGYSSKLSLAFEHHGQQHYKFIPYYHKTIDSFKRQQSLDLIKIKWCQKMKIKLIEIPYTINEKDLIPIIQEKISARLDIKLKRLKTLSTYKRRLMKWSI